MKVKLFYCTEFYFWHSYSIAFQIIVPSVQFFDAPYIMDTFQDVKWRRTTLCFLYCDIQIGSSLVEKEAHKAADCLVQSHLRASNKCFLHGTVFPLFPLVYFSSPLSVFTHHSCFKRAFFPTSTFSWT